jgi:UDP-N-acetylglucosamine--N-acetylmuramyl-(pentapeptide) pyrophosphoryl-undecaprenol N-acetylglucosamine transferase
VLLATRRNVCAPVLCEARLNNIPIVIELPDLEPGWAIRATWRLSRQVAVSFDQVLGYFPRGRATVTGYPVRAEFFRATRAEGRAHFKLDTEGPVVAVMGGSQGAHALNEAIRGQLGELLTFAEILHISGPVDQPELALDRRRLDPLRAARYHLHSYLDEDLPLALAAADVIVARAGAAVLGEFPAVGVPAILVPGLFAAGHQEKNADLLVQHAAGLKLPEDRLAAELLETIKALLQDAPRRAAMAAAMKRLARPGAAQAIGALLEQV